MAIKYGNGSGIKVFSFKSYASSSSGNVNLISDGKTTLMLDCGLSWPKIKKAMNFKTSSINSILLSHCHADHSLGCKDAMKDGIDCYMLPETKDALKLSGHRLHEIELKKMVQVGTFKIKAFPLIHDVPNCGFLIMNQEKEYAAYITDTAYCEFLFPALSLLAIDANYQDEILNENVKNGSVPAVMKNRLLWSHFSLENVLKLLRDNDLSKLREIHLLHLSSQNSNAAYIKKAVQSMAGKPTYIAPAASGGGYGP